MTPECAAPSLRHARTPLVRWIVGAARRLRTALDDLVLGSTCAGCGTPGSVLCAVCADHLHDLSGLLTTRVGVAPVVACGPYRGTLRQVIIASKDRGVRSLARPLGALAARHAFRHLPTDGRVLLVPVPSSPAAMRRRGYDHVGELGRVVARRLRARGVRVRLRHRLVRVRSVRDQAGLGRDDRLGNQRGSMRWRGAPPDAPIVIIDDIVTTGATLREACRAVEAAGGRPVLALALAHTALSRPALVLDPARERPA
ncbi:MAG: phosphoribosyltransferase family protein [Propionibacterium sp.]|nr:phosphoribosyltransferase family protein [Propionibacterium sp.]